MTGLADVVVLVHFGFIVFVALGGLLALRYPRLALLHIPAAVWGASVQFGDWRCPLTHLEDALRGETRGNGFVERAVMPLVYPDLLQEGLLTPALRVALGVLVVAVNVAVYAVAVLRWRRRYRLATSPPVDAPCSRASLNG